MYTRPTSLLCDYTLVPQTFNLILAHSQCLPQNLISMLPQSRRRHPNAWFRITPLDRCVHHLDGPTRRMLNLLDHIPRQHMLMLQRGLDVIDGRIGHPTPLQNLEPLLRTLLPRLTLNQLLERIPMLDAHSICHKALVSDPLGLP